VILGGTPPRTQTPPGGLAVGTAAPSTEVPTAAAADAQSGARPAALPKGSPSAPESPESMLARAEQAIAAGKDPQTLIRVAIAHRDHWGRLEEGRAAEPEKFDGRASIYTGETYAQARDRWDAYRLLLVEDLRGTHGGC
jgi:hypothetical protein